MGVMLRPSTFTKGGLIDDVDVQFNKCRFVLWNYGRDDIPEVPALRIKMISDEGDEHEDFLSAGDAKHFVPSEDGQELVAVGSKQSLNDNSNFAIFLRSMIEIGFDESKLADKISILDGMKAHIRRIPQPKRAGLLTRPGQQGDQPARERTVLTVTEIKHFPYDGAAPAAAAPAAAAPAQAAAPAAAAPAAAAPAAAPAAAGDVDEKLSAMVVEIAKESGGSVTKAALVQAVFKKAVDAGLPGPEQKALTSRVFDDTFLPLQAALGRIQIDGDTIKAG